MTIIRESRGPRLEAIRQRAAGEGGEAFADGLCNRIDLYRSVAVGDWPEWPSPGDARRQAKRIMDAAGELLSAYGEASERVQARLRYHLRESGLPGGALDTGGGVAVNLAAVHAAAAEIYRAQPKTQRKGDTRDGFLHELREHFKSHGVTWSSTLDGLAVRALAFADGVPAGTASKAIQRID